MSAPFDVGEVMRRVHFAWRPEEEGGFSAGHSTYAAHASGSGAWTFTGFHQSAEWGQQQSAPLRLETSSLERGGRLLTPPGNAGVSEDGSLSIARGAVVERLRNGEEGVRQSWTFAHRPSGTGPLTVRLRVEGLPFVGETASGLHFADASGLGVRYGAAAWTDARGASTPVRVRYEAGQVLMEVPAEVVEAAAYPAMLSPTVSPEFGMDTPVSSPAARIQSNPDIGFDGQNFLVVWQDSRGSTSTETYDIFGARVSLTGTVLDPLGILISNAAGDQASPAVAFDGQNSLVVWQDGRGNGNRIYGARVTTAGAVLDPQGILLNTGTSSQVSPTLAFDGQNYLVAWQDWRNSTTSADIYGTRVSPAGTVLDPNGIVICAEPYYQSIPDMAFDGQNYLLVWQDHRGGSVGGKVFGGRVSPSGAVLDGSGFAISRATSSGISPAVAFDGTNFLVVWYANSGTTSFYDIYGTRVSRSGTQVDAADFVIGTAAEEQQTPALAFDGQNYLVTWEDARNDAEFDIYAARVSPARAVSSSFTISTGTGAQLAPAVGVGGGVTFLVWSDARSGTADLYGARMTAFGGPVEIAGIRLSWSGNTQLAPTVASNGQDYFVVWQDDRSGTYDIYGVRVSADGTVLDSAGIAISTAANNQTSPVVLYNGQDYFVAWQDNRAGNSDIYGARVSPAGEVRDPTGIAISARTLTQEKPAIAKSGQNMLVVWSDERNFSSYYDIYGARVGLNGTVLDASGFPISTASSGQYAPAVAFDGQNYLVVWHDLRNGSTADIYGARVTPSGTLLTSSIPISTATGAQSTVSVAFGDYMYLVTWRDQRNSTSDIYGARVLPDSTVLDPGGFAVASGPGEQTLPAVAFDGQDFVVAWQHAQSTTGQNDLYGARVTLGAVVLDTPGFAIAGDASDERAPRLGAGAAGRLLLAYQRMEIQAPYGTQRVRARLLTTFGEPPDAGTPDAGAFDAGTPDAGAFDAGIPDAGSPSEIDAGLPDAGAPDAGAPDSGTPDAGEPDAGAPDSGTLDAGAPDSGMQDAGVDGGTLDGGGSDPGTLDGGGSDPGTPDAGGSDPGTPDASGFDAGTPDAGGSNPGTPDAGGADAGGPGEEGPDAGRLDAGTFDAGSDDGSVDAGMQDGGAPEPELPDAGSLDASVPGPADGGRTDEGIPDAGGPDLEGEAPGSCGCTGGGASSSLFYAGLLLAFAWRRRSRWL